MNRSCRQGLLCVIWNCWSVCVRVCVEKWLCSHFFSAYRIVKTFKRENFANCSLVPPMDATPPHFVKETFTNSHKTLKFANVLSLKKFSAVWYITTGNLT